MALSTDAALRAVNRFGLGAHPGQIRGLGDPRAWLEDQIADRPAAMRSTRDLPTRDEVGDAIRDLRAAQRARAQDELAEARRGIVGIAAREAQAALAERVTSDRPFVERLVAFWSNHLCVSPAGKFVIAPLAGLYEREVIRPHVLGRFDEMVLASARHPAMLLYLDNAQSIGPASRGGRASARRGRDRGLNENYARELLELHTLGVDGGYSQTDVVELARILTGWTVAGLGGPGDRRPGRMGAPAPSSPTFQFAPLLHEPGAKTVLGVRYDQGGEREGEAVIRDLCRHPSTARFIALKLVRHFVADDPPPADVERLARVFQETDGDLGAVARSLVHLESAWDPDHRKFRTPQDWLVAVLRALDVREVTPPLVAVLRQLRHPLWAPAAPKGFGDTRREWADPDALMNRAEFARTIANRAARAVGDPSRLLDVVAMNPTSPLPELLTDSSIRTSERVALLLGGPDFQWR